MADDKPTPAAPRGHAWRSAPVTASGSAGPKKPRTRRIVILGAVFLALLGTLAGVIYLFKNPTPPHLLTVPMSEYTDPHYPPLAFAQQDSKGLAEHYPTSHNLASNSQQLAQLRSELSALATAKHKTLIVHLRAHALTEGGEVYLIPGDGRADQSTTWMKLKDVLDLVQGARAKHRLLILDLFSPIADPRLGQLDDDLATKVHAALEGRASGDLAILCACSKQEVSLVSEELQRSVFGYYLDLGLRGWADGALDGKRDEQIKARELGLYVSRSVQRWAAMNRGLKQTPVLLGLDNPKDDFMVHWKRLDEQRTMPEAVTPPEYPAWLQDGWKLRQRWLDEGVHRLTPLEFRRLEARLLWAEQGWWGGKDPARVKTEFDERRQDLENDVKQARETALMTDPPRPVSLAQLRQPVDATVLADLMRDVRRVEQLKPDEKPAKTKEWQARPKDPKVKEGPTLSYNELAALVWQAAQHQDGYDTPGRLQWLSELLETHPERVPYAETLFLARLAGWKRVYVAWGEAKVVLPKMMEAVRDLELAVAGDPWALQWQQTRLQQVAAKLRETIENVFATRLWTENAASALDDLAKQARAITADVRDLDEGRRALDRGAVLLPACLYYFQNADRVDSSLANDWDEARKASAELRELLYPVDAGTPDVNKVKEQSERLTRALNRLSRPFEIKPDDRTGLKALVEVGVAPPSTYRELRARLSSPLLGLQDRLEVLKAMRTLGGRLHAETDKLDRVGMPTGDTTSGQTPVTVTAATADRRARNVLELLELAGLNLDSGMKRPPYDPLKIQNAWAVRLPQELNRADRPADELRLLQGIHPFTNVARRPGVQVRRLERANHWRWLGETFYDEQKKFYAERARANPLQPEYKQLQDFAERTSLAFARAGQL